MTGIHEDDQQVSDVNVRIFQKKDDVLIYEDFFLTDEEGSTMDIPLYIHDEMEWYGVEITKRGYQKQSIEHIEVYKGIHAYLKIAMRPLLPQGNASISYDAASSLKKPYATSCSHHVVWIPPAYIGITKNHKTTYVDMETYLYNIANTNINPTWPYEMIKTSVRGLLQDTFSHIKASYDSKHGIIYMLDEQTSSSFIWYHPCYDVINDVVKQQLVIEYHWLIDPVVDSFHASIRSMEDINYHISTDQSSMFSYGMRSDDIKKIQLCLSFLAKFYQELPPLLTHGTLDEWMKKAIYSFQSMVSLNSTGNLDASTQSKITSACDHILKLLYPPCVPPPYPESLQDQDHETICLLQRAINTVSYDDPAIPNVLVDGCMDDRCISAIKVFQQLFFNRDDGIIDKQTWDTLFSNALQIERGIHTNQGLPPFPKEPIAIGAHGPSILLIQNRLCTISNFYSSIPKIHADACFGEATHQCVLAFQALLGLKKDGIVNQMTWTLLHQVYQEVIRI